MSEKLLQDCVDELFALDEQTQQAQQRFLHEATTLLKGGLKLMEETKRPL